MKYINNSKIQEPRAQLANALDLQNTTAINTKIDGKYVENIQKKEAKSSQKHQSVLPTHLLKLIIGNKEVQYKRKVQLKASLKNNQNNYENRKRYGERRARDSSSGAAQPGFTVVRFTNSLLRHYFYFRVSNQVQPIFHC